MAEKQALAFIDKLRKNIELRRQLSALDESDWAGVVKVGKKAGFAFTISEIQAVVPPGFYRGAGARPKLGWSRDTVKKRKKHDQAN